MNKITVKIDGMMCGMCEAHICDTIRKAFPDAKKVKASRKDGEATFLTNEPIDREKIEKAIAETEDWAAAPHKYTVVYWKFVDKTMVMLDWDEDNNSGGNGYDYIDRNTISIGYGGRTYTFIYIGA